MVEGGVFGDDDSVVTLRDWIQHALACWGLSQQLRGKNARVVLVTVQ